MINPNASLPTIVIFERHFDTQPKLVALKVLPELFKLGYDTFCFEAPHEFTEDKIIRLQMQGAQFDVEITQKVTEIFKTNKIFIQDLPNASFSTLQQLIKYHVSSNSYEEVTQRVKQGPANQIQTKILNTAIKHHFIIRGVDVEEQQFNTLTQADISTRYTAILSNESKRIRNFADNLNPLIEKRGGVVFICGASHPDVISKLNGKVAYYFIHSGIVFSHDYNDLKDLKANYENHSYCLVNENETSEFVNRILRDVKTNNDVYKKEIEETSSSKILSHYFSLEVRTLMRPGFYVDALIATDQDNVKLKLSEYNIESHQITINDKTYLVVQDINTHEVASKILKLA